MPKPLRLPPLDEATLADLRQRYDATPDADLRLRYQMVLLAHQGRSVTEIATIVLRSHDTVTRLLNRFRSGGLDAVPRRNAPGGPPTLTPAWTSELLRVIDLDPHTVGVNSANWTTGLLATYLAEQTGITVSDETVRSALHSHGYVCKRPTWSLKRKAEQQDGYVGNA
jgi:transposase